MCAFCVDGMEFTGRVVTLRLFGSLTDGTDGCGMGWDGMDGLLTGCILHYIIPRSYQGSVHVYVRVPTDQFLVLACF